MKELQSMWARTGRGARIGLVAGIVLIAVLAVVAARWALAKDYEALFTGLAEQDASVMVAELERMKVPYQLEDGGQRILVPQELVHRTRLQLVGKNLPLHGAVGFEIFNNTDFGMTEFAQKVNYQRALQGELTRTIMSLQEVQAARVHLTLAESSMFKRDQNRSKASVTLTLKPGQQLAREQVVGIQRLIAAAVPGVEAGDVTVIDQKGITLSSRRDGERESAAWQLDTQRQIEEHLVRKAAAMLDRTFGPGQGVVSVDVLLNFDQVKVTTEEVLPAGKANDANSNATGVLVRERQTSREQGAANKDKPEGAATVINSDTEYQAGRRVEQIVATPGSVRRINVGVVVPRGVAPERLARVRDIVAMAVGLNTARGDGIAVYSLDQMAEAPAQPAVAGDAAAAPRLVPVESAAAKPADARETSLAWADGARYLLGALLALAAAAWWFKRRKPTPRAVVAAAPQPLPEAERARLLEHVKLWLEQPAPAAVTEEPRR